MHKLLGLGLGFFLFAATPSSTNYTLKNYDIGNGGGSSSSTNYKLNGTTGTQNGSVQSSTTYSNGSGLANTTNSSEPPAPTFTNPSNYYDRLKLVINTGNNPSDTKYLIAISTDNFATITNYVQTDNSVGSSGAVTNYQTYAAWGGASGFQILGLNPSTTYQVKVKAMQGNFTNTAFGPTASATTVATSLSVSLATSASSTPPYATGFSGLVVGAPTTATNSILVGLSTNALSGASAYVIDTNGGLLSNLAGYTIASATADLAAVAEGYGAQVSAVTQTSGGPLAPVTPFDGTASNVGRLNTNLKPILTSTAPIISGSGTVQLIARAKAATPSASDYTDTLTFVIAAIF